MDGLASWLPGQLAAGWLTVCFHTFSGRIKQILVDQKNTLDGWTAWPAGWPAGWMAGWLDLRGWLDGWLLEFEKKYVFIHFLGGSTKDIIGLNKKCSRWMDGLAGWLPGVGWLAGWLAG